MRIQTLSPQTLLLCASIVISGCASSPSTRYYTLSPVAQGGDSSSMEGDPYIMIGPFGIPEYLDRAHIVTRNGNQLILAEFDRWAEPMDSLLVRTITANIRAQIGSSRVLGFPLHPTVDPDVQVAGRIHRFEADENDEVVLTVVWGVLAADRSTIYPAREATYRRPVEAPGDYDAIVTAMNLVLADLSADIVAKTRIPSEELADGDSS